MNKWYQGIVVHHKEIDNKMYHCFDDENFKILTEERNEQLKEIERLNNIINELEKDMNRDDLSYVETQYVLDKLHELKGEDKE